MKQEWLAFVRIGNSGTLRVQMHLRQVLTFLNAKVVHRLEIGGPNS
ncbi:hypothetical protein [Sulfobacillus harzensis]|uniref:NAD(P)H-dependent oxidoreductase n=1 Tax=Sulfobacillus harzensis TaxID=2729629 RepID=A0A7Y0L4K4_9FIRM|nr:hypothetical protein [Sulfobacillus harzensis]NMP21759.1 NAD(P)H-dependent oxidoreductase [Sulfobacillus harzensis]